MKFKTSATLSEELIQAIDQCGQHYKMRSDFVEAAMWAFIKQFVRNPQNTRDLEMMNRNAERLNAEATDVLTYQVQL